MGNTFEKRRWIHIVKLSWVEKLEDEPLLRKGRIRRFGRRTFKLLNFPNMLMKLPFYFDVLDGIEIYSMPRLLCISVMWNWALSIKNGFLRYSRRMMGSVWNV